MMGGEKGLPRVLGRLLADGNETIPTLLNFAFGERVINNSKMRDCNAKTCSHPLIATSWKHSERIRQEQSRKHLWLYEGVVCVAVSRLRLTKPLAQWSFAT